jgi:hypothetical protein
MFEEFNIKQKDKYCLLFILIYSIILVGYYINFNNNIGIYCSDVYIYLLNALYGIARERGTEMTVSLGVPDADMPDSIYFPITDSLVTLLQNPPCDSFAEEKSISCAKFTSADVLSSCRVRLKGLDRIVNELSLEAKNELSYAKEAHNGIESIYIGAMDFSLLDESTFKFIKKLFGE